MKLKIQARAKINWTLDVVGTLPNGYHDLDMLMQSVTLCDQMTMEEALSMLGMTGVDVVFGSLAEASAGVADLFVVSAELEDTLMGLPVLGLDDLLDADQAADRLEVWLKENEY